MATLTWEIRGEYVFITYPDGETIKVSKEKFDRYFGPIVSTPKEIIKRDFAID